MCQSAYWPGHELDDQRIVVWFPGRAGYIFYSPERPDPLWGPSILLFSEHRVKAAEAWSWLHTPSSIAVKNIWTCIFVPPCSYVTPTRTTLPVYVVPRARFSYCIRDVGYNLQCHGEVSSHLCSLQSFLGLIWFYFKINVVLNLVVLHYTHFKYSWGTCAESSLHSGLVVFSQGRVLIVLQGCELQGLQALSII